MSIPERGHAQLRRFRYSARGASYFVTLCLRRGESGLADSSLYDQLMKISDGMEDEALWELRVLTLMPDHLHLIFRLISDDAFSDIIRVFKGRSSVALRACGLSWQKGGVFERRLRADDPLASVFRYIFLNPYRKGLVSTKETWPFFYCGEADWDWFQYETKATLPYPEWLAT
jgi:REP element-mobilizing transposase RayT